MFSTLARALWGDLTIEEYKKYGLLAAVFFFIIGTYWIMRSMKDAIFMKTVGRLGLPYAKMTTVIFMILLVLFYSKLVDLLQKQKLVYVFTVAYGVLFAVIAFFMNHPTIGLANTVVSKYRLFGWLSYLVIESFGSLVVAMFWSFVASSMDTTQAKRGYPLILGGAQFGSVLGCVIGLQASRFGMQMLAILAVIGVFTVPFLIKIFIMRYPEVKVVGTLPKIETGLVEGLRLLLVKPYLLGILAVSTLFEIIVAIFEYQMKTLANETLHTVVKVTEFEATFGLMVNILSLIFALVGASFFIRRFGLRTSLVAYPVIVACAICFMWSFHGLWVLAFGMVAVKGLSYALNNPCKEIMYIPTSTDVKFKAKSWIDVFGARSFKGVGGAVNACFPVITDLAYFGSIISLGVVGVWIAAAVYVGKTNQRLVHEGKIIE